MFPIRRRSPKSPKYENLEKSSVMNQKSRLYLLVSLSAIFWFVLLCFHFFVFKGNSLHDLAQFFPNSVSSDPIDTHQSNGQLSNAQSLPPTQPKDAQIALKNPINEAQKGENSSVINPKNSEKPPDVEDNTQSPPITQFEDTQNKQKEPEKAENPPVNESKREEPPQVNQLPNNTQKSSDEFPFMKALKTVENKSDPCGGKYVFVHDLPPIFNKDMLKDCKSLSLWTNMCKFTTNDGLGPPLENTEGVFSDTGWYATDQFAVDMIFSNRMKQYECLTNDSSLAAAVFVPFYAGFDIARYLWGFNTSVRDAASLALVDWLEKRPEWRIMGGRDHFLVAGRITWDFRRLSDENSFWGNKLLFLPTARNMSMLVVESSPWNGNDYGIPYPTYFHPAKDADVFTWQERMRSLDRKWLFSFAGAPRPKDPKSIRGQIINECRNSSVGKLLECDIVEESKCHSPSSIMKMFQSSIFCLQPQGDSYTRRSAFDSMLAGCIPVFFHPGSAYTQYTWHLPRNYSSYSVLIPENDIRKGRVSIEKRLSQISPEQVRIMRGEVINLIPRLIYADPRSKLETLKDAFDVSVQAMIEKVTKLRRDIVDGRKNDEFFEELSWKYALLEEGQSIGPHEWDPFFSKPKSGNEDSNG